MVLLLLALTQSMTASPPERVDLTIPQRCIAQRSETDEVVVCANRTGESPYRLKEPVTPEEGQALPKAEVKLADGVTAGAETEQADVGGFPSNRVMLGLKIKF